MSFGFWRRPARLAALEDGRLVPVGVPPPVEPASGEAFLHRDLAALADVTPATIADFASRYGPLHPTTIDLPDLESLLQLVLPEWCRQWRTQLTGLRHWAATGGAIPIAGGLVPMAYIVGAVAELDEPLVTALERALAQGALPENGVADDLIRRGRAALDRMSTQSPLVLRLTGLGDEKVQAPLPAHARSRAVRALALVDGLAEIVATHPQAWPIPRGWLGTISAEFSIIPGMEAWPFHQVATVDDWREAANELGVWRAGMRQLRSGDRSWARGTPERMTLIGALRGTARVPPDIAQQVTPETVASREAFRAELAALLIRRLQQEAAWPLPGRGVTVPIMARALWSLWPPLLGRQPPRYCVWPGCGEELPADSRSSRCWCDRHQAEGARERARRSYRSLRERTGLPVTGSGSAATLAPDHLPGAGEG